VDKVRPPHHLWCPYGALQAFSFQRAALPASSLKDGALWLLPPPLGSQAAQLLGGPWLPSLHG